MNRSPSEVKHLFLDSHTDTVVKGFHKEVVVSEFEVLPSRTERKDHGVGDVALNSAVPGSCVSLGLEC